MGGWGQSPQESALAAWWPHHAETIIIMKVAACRQLSSFMARVAVVVLGCLGTEGRSIPALWGCSAG